MSAIITQNFRLDTTQRFVDGLSDTNSTDTYYVGLGRPNAWIEDDNGQEVPHLPYENGGTTNRAWQELFAMKKLAPNDAIYAAPRNTWASGTFYDQYDDQHPNIEGARFTVISNSYSVFICLYAPLGVASISDPDQHVGAVTSGVVKTPDKYIWKYLYTLPVDIANKFLTTEFIPVQQLDADPGTTAAQALRDQWDVQTNAATTAGAIYSVVIDPAMGGSGYTSEATVVFEGNGIGAQADAIITNGVVTEIQMKDGFYGTGYDSVTVTVVDPNANSLVAATVRAVLSPRGGFGSDPRYDLRAHYVSLNKVFDGDEGGYLSPSSVGIPANGIHFRQITLIKNPNADSALAAAENYNTCKFLTMTTGDFAVDELIVAGDTNESGARGIVTQWDSVNNILYYIQNADTGFTPFEATDTIGSNNYPIGTLNDSAVDFNSGEVMFVENRDKVLRGSDQIETIRLVIEF